MNRLHSNIKRSAPQPPGLPDTLSDLQGPQANELDQIIKKFAPLVYFHNLEQAVPVTVDWYLQKVWLVNARSRVRVPASLTNLPQGPEHNTHYYLDPKEGISLFRQDDKIVAKTYVNVKTSKDHIDLQYWFLFAHKGSASAIVKWLIDDIMGHEGKINLNPLGKGNGVWERITVRIDKITQQAVQVFFPAEGKGTWVPMEKTERQGSQVVVYTSKNDCAFYPEPGQKQSEKLKFNLFSSRLEFSFQNEMVKGTCVDFSKSCELISATYLGENKPDEPLWLHFENNWGNPDPEHLTSSSVKRIVLSTFGKTLEFLLSRDILEELVHYLLSHFTYECRTRSLTPKSRKCWQAEGTE